MTKVCASLTALAAAALLAAVAAPPAEAARPLAGVPADASLLFSLGTEGGTLTPLRADGGSRRQQRRYRLTLTGLDRRVTWFTDRPRREAGSIPARRLFARWKALGFRRVPPNAVLVVDGAPRRRDSIAVELRLRSFQPRNDRVRFTAIALRGIGNGLRHLARRIDARVPARFGPASLFVDNASVAVGCTLGQPQLFATSAQIQGMLPADGRLLSIAGNTAVFSLYGTTFGGDGRSTFGLPRMTAPPGMAWWICTDGVYPSVSGLQGSQCALGEVDYWALPQLQQAVSQSTNWLPADGRTVSAAQYPDYVNTYGGGPSTVALPSLPAPPDMTSLVCLEGTFPTPAIAQVDLFVGTPQRAQMSLPTDGRKLAITSYEALYALLGGTVFSDNTFVLPTLADPLPGLAYYIAVEGIWPGS